MDTPLATPLASFRRAAAAMLLLSLSACGGGQREPSADEIAAKLEPAMRDDIPAEERRAAAAALAQDVKALAEESREVAATLPADRHSPDAATAAIARECERLAAVIEILKRRLDGSDGDRPTDAERAALPDELANTQARFESTCAGNAPSR